MIRRPGVVGNLDHPNHFLRDELTMNDCSPTPSFRISSLWLYLVLIQWVCVGCQSDPDPPSARTIHLLSTAPRFVSEYGSYRGIRFYDSLFLEHEKQINRKDLAVLNQLFKMKHDAEPEIQFDIRQDMDGKYYVVQLVLAGGALPNDRYVYEKTSTIGNDAIPLVTQLNHLEYLELYGTKISDSGLEHLRGCPALVYIGLSKYCTYTSLEHVVSGRRRIQAINVGGIPGNKREIESYIQSLGQRQQIKFQFVKGRGIWSVPLKAELSANDGVAENVGQDKNDSNELKENEE